MGLRVKDIMVKEVISLSPALGLDVLEHELNKLGIGGAPVVNHGEVLGVISRSDIIKQLSIEQTNALIAHDYYDAPFIYSDDTLDLSLFGAVVGERMANLTVKDIMNRNIISIEPSQMLSDAADLMLEKNIHRLLVVEDHVLVGLISSTDFVKLYSRKK